MALYKTLTVHSTTKVLIWKIEESIDELKNGISLTEKSTMRLGSMKSELHQKGFLSIRHLLKEVGFRFRFILRFLWKAVFKRWKVHIDLPFISFFNSSD